jgi:GNAT superfamily N-acetyltransferase
MKFRIRKAEEPDFESVLSLVKELAEFQKMPERVMNSVEQMKEEQVFFNCLVAENENTEIVAIATYFIAYYTWVGKSLYLDDLIVKQQYRGQKIGSGLLKEIFAIAKSQGCKRVRWQVSEWNKRALDFYRKCGAAIDKDCCNCDFDSKGIFEFRI